MIQATYARDLAACETDRQSIKQDPGACLGKPFSFDTAFSVNIAPQFPNRHNLIDPAPNAEAVRSFTDFSSSRTSASGCRIFFFVAAFEHDSSLSVTKGSFSRPGGLSRYFWIVDPDEAGTVRSHADGLQDAQRPRAGDRMPKTLQSGNRARCE
jgi:hypothetical protein